ncbi:tetratricopeptide repeat protein [Streptomyces sp. NPDC054833]
MRDDVDPVVGDRADPGSRRAGGVTVGADLVDFRGGRFHGDVVAKKVEHHHYTAPATDALQSLPAAARGFVGRHDELHALLQSLDPAASSHGTVVISAVAGLSGVGKTALAVRAAHIAKDRGLFPAGVVFLDLHGYDETPVTPGEALEQLLTAFGVPGEHMPASADARAGLYRSVLTEIAEDRGALLIVADNASRPSQVRPLLPGHPRHRVLVTSRDTLSQLGAQLLHLGVLPAQVAVEALNTALRTADPHDSRVDREENEAQRLSALCGHLPLALHIAAALLVNDPGKPVAELADELADAATRIDQLDDGERAIRAAFDMSYRRLDDGSARLFRLLALAPGPEVGMEALTALGGRTPAPRALDTLVRAHLIEPGLSRGRWRMHDLVRVYGMAKTQENAEFKDEGQAARARLLGQYHERVLDSHAYLKPMSGHTRDGGFRDREQALRWLDTERIGLVAAAQWAADPAHAEPGVRFALSLCHYLGWRNHFADAAVVYRHVLDGARLLQDPYYEGMAHDNLGIALRHLRLLDEAIAAHRHALELFADLDSPLGQGRAWYNLGSALQEAHHHDQALEAFEEADGLLNESGAQYTAALAQNGRATVHLKTGHFNKALDCLNPARDLFRSIGDLYLEAVTTNNLGRARRGLGHLDESRLDHARAMELFQAVGHDQRAAIARNDHALTLRAMGRLQQALVEHAEALRAVREQRAQYREAIILNDLGVTLRRAGRHKEAAECHRSALTLHRDVFSDPHGQAQSLDLYAVAALALGRSDDALRAWGDAVRLYREADAEDAAQAALRRIEGAGRDARGPRSQEAAHG